MKPLAVLAGLMGYGLFCWQLAMEGQIVLAVDSYLVLLAVWCAGLAILIVWPTWIQSWDDNFAVSLRTVWGNLGAVILAVLVPHEVRLMLLVVPIFGMFYAALYLTQRFLVGVTILTWLTYTICTAALTMYSSLSTEFEILSYTAFVTLLTGALFISTEVLRVRQSLVDRNRHLRTLTQQLRDMASSDELTAVHNRRSIMEILQRQKALVDRGGQTFALCYCDLDHFKRINDSYGHSTGDEALKMFANMTSEVIRSVDFVARMGGEEFLIVIVDTDENTSQEVARRVLEGARALCPVSEDLDVKMSVSIGVTTYRLHETTDSVIKRADAALYQAKQSGRDCVIVRN